MTASRYLTPGKPSVVLARRRYRHGPIGWGPRAPARTVRSPRAAALGYPVRVLTDRDRRPVHSGLSDCLPSKEPRSDPDRVGVNRSSPEGLGALPQPPGGPRSTHLPASSVRPGLGRYPPKCPMCCVLNAQHVLGRSEQRTAPSRSSFPTRHGRPYPHGSFRPSCRTARRLWGERARPRCAQGSLREQRQRTVKMSRLDGELSVTNFPRDNLRSPGPFLGREGPGAMPDHEPEPSGGGSAAHFLHIEGSPVEI